GADVVKVERPGEGDETRSWGPPHAGGEAAYFLAVNRGKRSVAVDLKHPEGLALALELSAAADVVIENFRPGAAARLGLDAAAIWGERASGSRSRYSTRRSRLWSTWRRTPSSWARSRRATATPTRASSRISRSPRRTAGSPSRRRTTASSRGSARLWRGPSSR